MNVLFYIHRYPGLGGIESVTTYLANYLIRYVESVSVFSFISQNISHNLDGRITIYNAPNHNEFNSNENIVFLQKILSEKSISHIIFQDSYSPIESCLFSSALNTNIKIYIVEHNTPDYKIKDFKHGVKYGKWYDRIKYIIFYYGYIYKLFKHSKNRHIYLYTNCFKYVLLTPYFIPIFKKYVSTNKIDKLICINNPLTIKRPIQIYENKEKICLFCGRLVKQKGINLLMQIWNQIEHLTDEWKLLVVGDGPEKSYIEDYIQRNNLKRLHLVGFQSDPSLFYEKASILCMTSIYEGWMLSLNEAMAYGCVPITFNSYEAAKEIIDSGINGYLIKPFSISNYTKILLDLINNPEKLKEISHNAYLKCEKFDIEFIGKQWLEELEII